MKCKLLIGCLLGLTAVCQMAHALEGEPSTHETPAQRDARMGWWREAKFGMFIHWGIYAIPAGTYEGKPVAGIGEWIMKNGKIPVATYRAYAKNFNPTKYDPKSWAALAQEAGMRYMVITSKHHDGFSLFPSDASDWDIADATPWKKDLIAPLADAARAKGLKFGLYYSQAQDWVHPGGAKYGMKEGDGWDEAHHGNFDSYIDQIAVPQVREILTRYKPDVLWWDTPHLMNPERAKKLAALLPLAPGIIHNNRLGGGSKGDTETPEQFIPATGFPGRDWETCMTMNKTWGYKSDDTNWKPLSTLITNLVDIVSKGGNYLLNVGPTADGEIPPESIQLLKDVGVWMKTNSESIYGTQASPFKKLSWGRCTLKPAGDDTILYLHVLNWPTHAKLTVPGLTNPVKSVELLAGGTKLTATNSESGPVVSLPTSAPDAICSTLKMVITGKPVIKEVPVAASPDGVIRLLPEDADFKGAVKAEDKKGISNIGFWKNPEDTVSWTLRADHDGKYLVQIEASSPSAGAVLLVQGLGKLAYSIPKTDNLDSFQSAKVGEVVLKKGNTFTLTLRPVPEGWNLVNVRKVELTPQP
jgi:alpha-L-fucosidase